MKHKLHITPSGYGHWKIATTHYGKEISTVTTDSMSIDDYNSEDDEKDGRELRKLRGYNALRSEIIGRNKR